MATLQMTDSQRATLTIQEVDRKGNPVDPGSAGFGTPQWQSSDETVVTVTPAVDGSSADVVAAGKVGTAQISVTVQGSDGNPLAGSLDVQIVSGAAASISISAGTPSEQ